MELAKLIEKTKEILEKSDIAFIDALEELVPEYDKLMLKVDEDSIFADEQKNELKILQQLHSEVLLKANEVMSRKGELIATHKKTAKGIKAYIDKYPKRISAFSKRKG